MGGLPSVAALALIFLISSARVWLVSLSTSPSCVLVESSALVWRYLGRVGGWIEEKEAVGMRCWTLWVGGWVGVGE